VEDQDERARDPLQDGDGKLEPTGRHIVLAASGTAALLLAVATPIIGGNACSTGWERASLLVPVGAALLAMVFSATLLRRRHWLAVGCLTVVVGAVVLFAALVPWGLVAVDHACSY